MFGLNRINNKLEWYNKKVRSYDKRARIVLAFILGLSVATTIVLIIAYFPEKIVSANKAAAHGFYSPSSGEIWIDPSLSEETIKTVIYHEKMHKWYFNNVPVLGSSTIISLTVIGITYLASLFLSLQIFRVDFNGNYFSYPFALLFLPRALAEYHAYVFTWIRFPKKGFLDLIIGVTLYSVAIWYPLAMYGDNPISRKTSEVWQKIMEKLAVVFKVRVVELIPYLMLFFSIGILVGHLLTVPGNWTGITPTAVLGLWVVGSIFLIMLSNYKKKDEEGGVDE